MKLLIYYHHGLGDCILLTPQLKYFHEKFNAEVTLLGRKSVISSKLFQDCPYVGEVVEIDNPWESAFENQLKLNYRYFRVLSKHYSNAFFIDHRSLNKSWSKVFSNSLSCRIFDAIDIQPEVFVSKRAKEMAEDYIHEYFPDGFIFKHTIIPLHKIHTWSAYDWIEENLPDLPIFDVARIDTRNDIFSDINVTFHILSRADHVVLSSSVMAHAADAMKKPIDVLNYGKPDYYNLPVNKDIVRRLRVQGRFVDVDGAYSSLQYPDRVRVRNVLYDQVARNNNRLKNAAKKLLTQGIL